MRVAAYIDGMNNYLAALGACCPLLRVIEGRFQERFTRCRSCGQIRATYDEKETDVNIAMSLTLDAVNDVFDTALLFSADSDLAPAVLAAAGLGAAGLGAPKRIVAVFPPRRRSDVLRQICAGAFTLGDAKIRAAQLPDRIVLPSGLTLERPPYWR